VPDYHIPAIDSTGWKDTRGESHPHDRVGDRPIGSTTIAVITRFGLRSPLHVPLMYMGYRRVLRRSRGIPGFLRSAFLVEGPRTCMTISIWAKWEAIPVFGTTVPEHVAVARRSFSWLRFAEGRPELWSAKWRLSSVSNNLTWDDFDLGGLLNTEEATGQRQ